MNRRTEVSLLFGSWGLVLALSLMVVLRERPSATQPSATYAQPSEPGRVAVASESPPGDGEQIGPTVADREVAPVYPEVARPIGVPGHGSVTEGDAIMLSVDGMSLGQFVILGEQILGREISYRAEDMLVAHGSGVRLAETVTVPRKRFFSFFSAVLHAKGLHCTTRRRGEAAVVEIVAMAPEDRPAVDRRPLCFVSFDDLQGLGRTGDPRADENEDHEKAAAKTNESDGKADRKQAAPRILTAIPLEFAAGAEVRLQLRRYFANLDSSLGVSDVTNPDEGEELILWGTAADVAKAAKLIDRLDRRVPR